MSDSDIDEVLDSDTDDVGLNGADMATADSFDLSVGKFHSLMMIVSNHD